MVVAVGVCVAEASGVDVLAGRSVGVGRDLGVGVAADTGADWTDVLATLASAAFTNFFDGALGGGVASDFIFARTTSASRWLPIAAQPRSIAACLTVCFTAGGRSTRCRVMTGAGISITSPLTTARGFSSPSLI